MIDSVKNSNGSMNLGELDLDGNDSERVMKSSVTLAYDRFEENKFDE